MPTVARVWPDNCELIYVAGTRKIMLTLQRPVMRTVFQEAFEHVHAYLLLTCAFPDASAIPTIIRDALLDAASANVPRASNICTRLMQDDEYAARMSRLVSHFLLRYDMIRLIIFFSHALAFLSSEGKLRTTVQALYR
jgi:hypothetical protein